MGFSSALPAQCSLHRPQPLLPLSEPASTSAPGLCPEEPALRVPSALPANTAFRTLPPTTALQLGWEPSFQRAGAAQGSATNLEEAPFGIPVSEPAEHRET